MIANAHASERMSCARECATVSMIVHTGSPVALAPRTDGLVPATLVYVSR